MDYVPGFQYDLFVSYATEDHDPQLVQFISDLRAYLSRELGKLFTERSIFFDRQELNRTPVEWKSKLEQSAGSAAILVPFLSESYATSDYCALEWEWFSEGFSEDRPLRWPAGTETVYRVCPVKWRALDDETLRQIAPEIRSAQEQRTYSAEELGAKIANGLRLMRRSRQTVYIGETEDEVRLKLRDEMSRMGFRVMPESRMAYGDSQLIRTRLGEARLAVHFVGGQTRQRAIDAIRWSRQDCSGATVVFEIPGYELTPAERVSLTFIEEDLRKATPDDSRAYDRVSGKNFDQFLEILRYHLEGVRPVRPTRLGIACEETDRPAAEAIIPEIRARTGFSVICHGEAVLNFKNNRGILFYWGAAEGRRLRQFRPASRGLMEAFFLAPPPKPAGHEEELADVLVLRQQGERFLVDDLRPFLQELGWTG